MQSIDFHDKHLDPPAEREVFHCETCKSELVERYYAYACQYLPVCGNPECPDCDPHYLIIEKENEQ